MASPRSSTASSIGAYPRDADDVEMLAWMKVDRVLNLVDDGEYDPGEREAVVEAYAAAGHRGAADLDSSTSATCPPRSSSRPSNRPRLARRGPPLYLHCRAGRQRSAVVAAGVVAIRDHMDLKDALRFVHQQKPSADPLPHQRA